MKVGTKSVLFGAHAFWLHPWFVAFAWWRLFGFPRDPRLWVAFFIHDLGYWGSPNMDGPEGERHPEWAARVMTRLFDRYPRDFVGQEGHVFLPNPPDPPSAELVTAEPIGRWGRLVLFHSRFYAKKHEAQPSRLCIADKLAICLTPWWLYLPMARATGEIHEYRELGKDEDAANKYASMSVWSPDEKRWYLNVQAYLRRWVEEHRDGREDTWTPDAREARDETGVWP